MFYNGAMGGPEAPRSPQTLEERKEVFLSLQEGDKIDIVAQLDLLKDGDYVDSEATVVGKRVGKKIAFGRQYLEPGDELAFQLPPQREGGVSGLIRRRTYVLIHSVPFGKISSLQRRD
jgi:hypothetical protein